jgi:hypothetical protein
LPSQDTKPLSQDTILDPRSQGGKGCCLESLGWVEGEAERANILGAALVQHEGHQSLGHWAFCRPLPAGDTGDTGTHRSQSWHGSQESNSLLMSAHVLQALQSSCLTSCGGKRPSRGSTSCRQCLGKGNGVKDETLTPSLSLT